MPIKMSIEVVKHSEQDIRVCFKDGKTLYRVKFVSDDEANEFLHREIDFSRMFLDYTWKTSKVIDFCEGNPS